MTGAERAHVYASTVTWSGEPGSTDSYARYSRAHVIAAEGKPDVAGSADPAFRGDASRHNPEDLLVAALASCHLLAYLALCSRERIAIVSYVDHAEGTMRERAGAGRFASALLRPEVVLVRDEDVDRAFALHDAAHAECFIANSVNFPVEHAPVVRGPSRERRADSPSPLATEPRV